MLIKLTMSLGDGQYRPVLINANAIESVHLASANEWKCNLYTSSEPESPYHVLESFEEIERIVNGETLRHYQSHERVKVSWPGGDLPLPYDQDVKVYFRGGGCEGGKASKFHWRHEGLPDDIVAFEVL